MDREDFNLDMDSEAALATTDDVDEAEAEAKADEDGDGGDTDTDVDTDSGDSPATLAAGSVGGVAGIVDEELAPGIPATSRKIRRRGRRTRMRSKTIAMKRLTKEEIRLGALMYPPLLEDARPRTRVECLDGPRPCPYVSCKHHLFLDVNPETGSIKLNFPDLEVWDMKDTCSLDVADRNGITLEEVGEIMNLTRERIRQVEVRGLLRLKMMTAFGADD